MGFRQNRSERGAALVEMALLTPLLLLLVLGIIELGLLIGQMNELRHGVREGARYAAVSSPDLGEATWNDNVVKAVCDSVNLPGAVISVTELSYTGSGDRLDNGTIEVEADVSSITGAPIVSLFVPDVITNGATFRLEQNAKWTGFSGAGNEKTCP